MDFSRNYLFIEAEAQEKLKSVKILLIGVGLGSFVAEALIRMGIHNICICDGDTVSESNLNRQNYIYTDISKSKAIATKNRLKHINPDATIKVVNKFMTESSMKELIPKYDIVVNTIDFDSPAFVSCHKLCQLFNKVEIFPMNLGFGFGTFVFTDKYFDSSFSKNRIIDYVISNQKQSNKIKRQLVEYHSLKRDYDPQLIVGSLGNAAMICSICYSIIAKQTVRSFPDFYFLDFSSL